MSGDFARAPEAADLDAMLELAERCEAATGPDRELDAGVAIAIGWTNVAASGHGHVGHCPAHFFGSVPTFTASLDAAMTLVPEGYWWEVGSTSHASVGNMNTFGGDAATPALALCAAALRAIAERKCQC